MKRSVLFIVINGAGLGHLTRALAVAKRLKILLNDYEIVFYTSSLATEIVSNHGFLCYYIPARELMPDKASGRDWETLIQKQLEYIIDIHHPMAAVFDGAYPSTAILIPLMKESLIKKLWIKREGDRLNMLALDVYEKYFDHILVPEEFGLEHNITSKNKQYFTPIMLIDKKESYERQQVRETFRINKETHLWYVQLGNYVTKDEKEQVTYIINLLLQNERNVIILGESILKDSLKLNMERVITIKNYPNSMYFKGIDFAVSAAGYNTFHELLYFQIPSIFIPNNKVLKDDQVARAKRAKALGVGIALENTNNFKEALVSFENSHQDLHNNFEKVKFENGALQAAEYIFNQIN